MWQPNAEERCVAYDRAFGLENLQSARRRQKVDFGAERVRLEARDVAIDLPGRAVQCVGRLLGHWEVESRISPITRIHSNRVTAHLFIREIRVIRGFKI